MEIGVQKPGGFEITGKSMSLDVHSIYVKKSRSSTKKLNGNDADSVDKKEYKELTSESNSTFDDCGALLVELKQKRSREGIELSSFERSVKKRTKNLSDVGCSLVTRNDNPQLHNPNTHQSVNAGNGSFTVDGSFESKNGLGRGLVIPKRPRGASKWRKTSVLASANLKNNSLNLKCNQNGKSSVSRLVTTEVLTSTPKKKDNDLQQNVSVGENSYHTSINETSSLVQSNDEKNRTRMDFVLAEQESLRENTSVVDGRGKSVGYSQQYEEENLEENAARMLSSRFDPRCTGFSSFETTNTSTEVKVSPNAQTNHVCLKHQHTELSSADASSRTLRPMKQNGKSFSRKRRHFYEVLSKDMDPLYIVKQRIRIYWPLDDSWYFGLVKAYDPVSKLHHVKYDDRDEEWINLQNERFKLLLFPSEVSRKFNGRRIVLQQRKKSRVGDAKARHDGCVDNLSDSETFNSWLTRATHQRKSMSTSVSKKQSTNKLSDMKASILLESMGELCGSPSDNNTDTRVANCSLQKWSDGNKVTKNIGMKSSIGHEVCKLQYVYSRKRSRGRRVVSDKLDEYAGHCIQAGSLSKFAYADSTSTIHHLKIVLASFQDLTMTLGSQIQYIWEFSFLTKMFLLSHAISIFHYGILISMWPVVRMEILFVDRDIGIRLLLFEGCLRRAVTLLCLMIRTFSKCDLKQKYSKSEVPVTVIGIEITSLHSLGGKLLLLMIQFLKLENATWRNIKDKLNRHFVMKELEVANFTNTKWFSKVRAQMISGSVVCDKCLIKSNSGVFCSHFVNSSMCEIPFPHSLLSHSVPSTSDHKFVTENDASSGCLSTPITVSSQEHMLYTHQLTIQGFGPPNDSFEEISEVGHAQSDNCSFKAVGGHANQNKVALCGCGDNDSKMLAQNSISDDDAFVYDCSNCEDLAKNNVIDNSTQTLARKNGQSLTYEKSFSFPHTSSKNKSYERCNSCCETTNIQPQFLDNVHNTIPKDISCAFPASDVSRNSNELRLHSPTAPRSTWHRNQNTSVFHTVRRPKLWQDDFMPNGPLCGFRKPRSQISYASLSRNYSFGSKYQPSHLKAQSHKKIKSDNLNRTSDCTGSSQSFLDSLTSEANVLVTSEDKGWRECGAQVVLDSVDKNNWSICVKVLGSTKYYHKVQHILQPGATNRYTHAIMWKGGKEWTLEFTDRSQWAVFKQIYEECYNRNIRAASIKNIPIPGVRLIANADDNTTGVPFVRSISKYFRQDGTYVDFALDPSHVLYDMDSEDEEWTSRMKSSSDSTFSHMSELTEDLFEIIMDMFEKFAYKKQCHEFTPDEIDELMDGVGQADLVKAIYEHWKRKRQKKGLPLIRHFQPPMWEFYQQQLKDWESAMSKLPNQQEGHQDRACSIDKPPMFAFCLRPRGLKVPNKGSKQRSHKKLMYSNHHAPQGIDGFQAFGKKLDVSSAAEQKTSVVSLSYESSDSVHEPESLVTFSPKDTMSTESLFPCDAYDKFIDQRLYRYNSKKTGAFLSPKDSQLTPFSPGQRSKRHGTSGTDSSISELPTVEQSNGAGIKRCPPDVDEFRLRDASSAAQHALNMAKLKREKANWLLHKADLAIHRATVALITAEAIKMSEKDTAGGG